MISSVTVIQRGIQTYSLTARMTRSAILVLPLPGAPVKEHGTSAVDRLSNLTEYGGWQLQIRESTASSQTDVASIARWIAP